MYRIEWIERFINSNKVKKVKKNVIIKVLWLIVNKWMIVLEVFDNII